MAESQMQSGAKPDAAIADVLFARDKLSAELASPEDKETVKLVMGLFTKAKLWKATWSKDHDRFWNEWESNHYKGRLSHTLTRAVVNQVWSAVETFVAHVVDALPEPITRARKPENRERAKSLTKWLKYEFDVNDVEQEIQHPTREACVTGAGWGAVEWDETRLGGKGDVKIYAIDGKHMFPAPYARNLDECLYIIEAKNVPRESIIRAYPERGQSVPPGSMDASLSNIRAFQQENRHDAAAPSQALFTTTTGSDSRWTGSSGTTSGKKNDLVTLYRAWVRQDDGTMRHIVIGNTVLLFDGLSPYDDDDFPYFVVNVIPTMDTIHGRGIVQFIEGLQELLNSTISYLLDQQRFASDPMLIVSSMNLEDGQLVDNSPGAVLPDSDPNRQGYNWLQAPGFNQAWLQIQEIVTNYMDSVLGRVDVIKGENPAGVSTLGGLEIIRDEANVRLRGLIRWVKASMKRMYKLTLSRLRQYAKDERTVRVAGKGGGEEFVTVNPMQSVSPEGEPVMEETIPADAEFDVEFGKEVPGGRQARIELALQLAGTPAEDGQPMIDRQKVLEEVEYEDAPEIIERMTALADQQAASQAEQAREQAGQPPAGDPMDQIADLLAGARQ